MRNLQCKRISVIFGTRPEAIKLAPVIMALRQSAKFDCRVCVTAQHREMLDQVLSVFGISPDIDLDLMAENQTLGTFTARAIQAIDKYMLDDAPDLILVQGDTTTVFCAALTAFYHRIPIGHVEAGLRTWNLLAPWPEEANRVLTTRLAAIHFAPTEMSRRNLLSEGVKDDRIIVTGNPVIDALFIALKKIKDSPPHIVGLPDFLQAGSAVDGPCVILITGHRRENFGKGLESICQAIVQLANNFPSVHFVYPIHPNPNVREPVMRMLGATDGLLSNIHLVDPLPYLSFVTLMNRSYLILTDSGGVQEEAPSLGKPVLVLRDTTERPEAVEAGTVKLVGTNADHIVMETTLLLTDRFAYKAMAGAHNPYGDGQAAERIRDACGAFLNP